MQATTRSLPGLEAYAEYPWAQWGDEQLLDTRICDLGLRLAGSDVEPLIDRLYDELGAHDLRFRPRGYLTTEWLCPDRVPLIGIPFCLAHPRLKALEKSQMLEVEGGTERTFMRLARHETGHAINYAYQLYRRTRWRELFGPISREYDVQEYYPRPYSRQYVEHLPDCYAQSHPDEDFAETFAVWLTPGFDWRARYHGWKALQKLEYVDKVMAEIAGKPPQFTGGGKLWPINRVRSTLRTYYRRKQRDFGDGYPGFYDPELHRLFAPAGGDPDELAWVFLRRHRKHLTNLVASWGHFRKYEVDQVLHRMYLRARELRLYRHEDETDTLNRLCVYLTALLSDHRARQREIAH